MGIVWLPIKLYLLPLDFELNVFSSFVISEKEFLSLVDFALTVTGSTV